MNCKKEKRFLNVCSACNLFCQGNGVDVTNKGKWLFGYSPLLEGKAQKVENVRFGNSTSFSGRQALGQREIEYKRFLNRQRHACCTYECRNLSNTTNTIYYTPREPKTRKGFRAERKITLRKCQKFIGVPKGLIKSLYYYTSALEELMLGYIRKGEEAVPAGADLEPGT